ncbi:hypothetical protein [Emticicia agri]|uniref:Uncharacterized protein n=1 Tax=Emticicia agri TaxID=2492393 RepID=A0A4Q5M580_9BACT|nr:hypothetical protein [Emticicia agri]RYU97656.1 hypothetical protein EWM59_00610 [Emticicia agri]
MPYCVSYKISFTAAIRIVCSGILIFVGLTFNKAYAQKPIGRFLTDSVELGRPFDYALSYYHSPSDEVFFPDTAYNFYPFELIRRNYFTTNTTNNRSLDSVVYTLVTFDINKTQKFNLPVYILGKRDCTAVFAPLDSVFLRELIRTSTDSLMLKTDTKLMPLQQQVNYPKILGYLLGLLGILGIIYAFFGKWIEKQYRLFVFARKHKDFVSNYKKVIRGTLDSGNIGKALVMWKEHLEWLENRPYTSYTSKEIINRLPSESLEESLRDVDTAIYGGILSTHMPAAMNVLLNKAVELYRKRREELAINS